MEQCKNKPGINRIKCEIRQDICGKRESKELSLAKDVIYISSPKGAILIGSYEMSKPIIKKIFYKCK